MFKGWQIVTVAMLVWGNFAFASLPSTVSSGSGNAGQDLQTIASWMAHLNHFYPGLEVAPAEGTSLGNPAARQQLMQDLNDLEEMLGQGSSLPNSSLKQIACGRPECNGGGGGGKCSTCQVNKE